MSEQIPQTVGRRIITGQLIASGTSVGSNYRATCRARSKAEFNSKLQTVLEEADESTYWIEVLLENQMVVGEE